MDIATLASQAEWSPDSPDNLIALPADTATQQSRAPNLPVHNSNHPDYDEETLTEIFKERAIYYDRTPTPAQARAIFERVAARMKGRILAGEWMPRLR